MKYELKRIRGVGGYWFVVTDERKAWAVQLRMLGMGNEWARFWAFVEDKEGDQHWIKGINNARKRWLAEQATVEGYAERGCTLLPDELKGDL